MNLVIRHLRLLLLGVWLGAAIFFGAAVAPALFNVLRAAGLANANELAGSIVTRLLGIINQGGFEIGLFLFVTGFFVNRYRRSLARFAEMISLAIMTIMTGVSHWIISARMLELRRAMGTPIDQVSPADPRHISFDSLHRYSVIAMGVAIIAGLVAFVVAGAADRLRAR
jgi:hypothetical protein